MISDLEHSFNIKPHKIILKSDNEKLKGLKGYISAYKLNLNCGFEHINQQYCVGITESNEFLNHTTCDEILSLECLEFIEDYPIDESIKEKSNNHFEALMPSITEPLIKELDKDAKLPISHIQMLAEKEKSKLEKEIKDLQREIDRVKNMSATDSFGEGLAKNQKINELSEQLFELKDNEFIKKSKINRETKQKIEEIYNKSLITNTKSDSFVLYFEVR